MEFTDRICPLPPQMNVTSPHAPDASRAQFRARLNRVLSHRLALLIAPRGSGKTMALRDWRHSCGCLTAWVSLSEHHNVPERFIRDLVEALSHVAPTLHARSIWEPDGTLTSLKEAMARLINALADVSDTLILILDDYDVIRAAPIHEAMAMLLDYMPPAVHVIIASSEDPPLPLARLRVRMQLVSLGTEDLQMT